MKEVNCCLVIILICTLFSCGNTEKPKVTKAIEKVEKPSENANNLRALKEIKTESKIKNAFISDDSILYVEVLDDGTSRDGYADYLCQVLLDFKPINLEIKVIKYEPKKELKNGVFNRIILGESNCKY
ncbi:hypothetical protein [Aquimarina longa]|uniref:hypothetical protein n=1 Tax=Aquimarina longa TaxID=1080221 RepID=UPI000A982E31|nr:hypothetical protein [Aquimarina longa]